ncbi:hypothetical protein, partial [Caballeronia sp. M23-90]
NIGEVLTMEIDEAVEFFSAMQSIAHPLQLMKDVGLGYLTLGHPWPALQSGNARGDVAREKHRRSPDDGNR